MILDNFTKPESLLTDDQDIADSVRRVKVDKILKRYNDARIEAAANAILDEVDGERFDGRDHNDQTGWRP